MHILGHSNDNNVILYSPQNLVEINVSLAADQDRHLLRLWISWYPLKTLQFWPLPLNLLMWKSEGFKPVSVFKVLCKSPYPDF